MKKEIIYVDKDTIKEDDKTINKIIKGINECDNIITKEMLLAIIQDRNKFIQKAYMDSLKEICEKQCLDFERVKLASYIRETGNEQPHKMACKQIQELRNIIKGLPKDIKPYLIDCIKIEDGKAVLVNEKLITDKNT